MHMIKQGKYFVWVLWYISDIEPKFYKQRKYVLKRPYPLENELPALRTPTLQILIKIN